MPDDLIDTAPCGYVALAGDGTVVRANTTLANMVGLSAGEIEGRRFEDLLTAGGRVFYQTHFFPMLKLSGHVEEIYLALQTAGGAELPVLVNGAQRQSSEGVEYVCVLVLMQQRDRYEDELVLARKRAEEASAQLRSALLDLDKAHTQLKSTQAQLIQSEKMRALGQIIASVAHEINNPTAFVAANVDYLAKILPRLSTLFDAYAGLRQKAGAAEASIIEQMEAELDIEYLWRDLPVLVQESLEGLQRIRDIVLTLRNFARLDEADMKLANVNEGIRSTLQILRSLFKGQVRIVESYGELPEVLCRPRELNQVFLNLLTNAAQSIKEQGTIWVSTEHRARKVIVAIRDTGDGMDEAVLTRLGEPFFTTKQVGTGVGLGLSISFSIVEAHHGRLSFASAPGEGTTATIELPADNEQK